MEDSRKEMDETLDAYPEGNYSVVAGSILRGFKHYGPFTTMRAAVEWADARTFILGNVTVVTLESPDAIRSQE